MNKKWLISLGAIAAVTPVIAVVACGKIQEPSSTDLDNYRKFTSAEATRILEEQWNEKVLFSVGHIQFGNRDQTNGQYKIDLTQTAFASLKESAMFVVKQQLIADPLYLSKLASKMLGDNVTQWNKTDLADKAYFDKIGMTNIFNNQVVNFTDATPTTGSAPASTVTTEAINLLMNYLKDDFRLKVYKQATSELFLKTNKDAYTKAFTSENRNLSLIQQAIKADDFVLINEMLSQKLFATWNVTLDENTSRSFIGKKYTNVAAIQTAFGKTGDFTSAVKSSQTNVKENFPNLIADGTVKYSEFVGWKGFATQAVVSTSDKQSIFNYTIESLKAVTDAKQWEGVIQEKTIVKVDDTSTEIKAIPEEQKVVNQTYLIGLMPIYQNNEFQLDASYTGVKKDELIRLLAYKNQAIYSKASQFYRTKVETREPILVVIPQQALKDIYTNQGFEFIKERKAE